jgi:hypothetical protein
VAQPLDLRTSWVYNVAGNNFMKTAIRLAQQKESYTIVGDQLGAPTWASTITAVCCRMLAGPDGGREKVAATTGTYHLTARGGTSWHGYATLIARELAARGVPLNSRGWIRSRRYPLLPTRRRPNVRSIRGWTAASWNNVSASPCPIGTRMRWPAWTRSSATTSWTVACFPTEDAGCCPRLFSDWVRTWSGRRACDLRRDDNAAERRRALHG